MRRALSSLAVGLLVLLSACNEEGLPISTAGQTASADAPVITAIDQKDLGNGFVGLTAKATDPKNRALTFTWRVDNGQLSQATGRAVTWKVPTQPGDYTATLEVKNDTGAAATATQRFTVSQTGQVQAQGTLQVASSSQGGTTVNGRFVIPSPLGSQQANPPIVGGVVPAPSAALPTPPNSQPVATPAPPTPVATFGPAQPIATATPTPPPEIVPPSPFPSPSPATPEPEVAQRAPVRWQVYDATKIPVQNINWQALHFLSPTKGYIAGAGGNVLLYDRTGDTEPALVTRKTGLPSFQINKIRFASETVGFVAGNGGRVYRTTDAAVNWEDVSPPFAMGVADVSTMVVTNAQIMTIADSGGRVFRNESLNAGTAAEVQAGWVALNVKPDDRPVDVASRIYAGTGFAGDPTLFYFAGFEGIFRLDTDNPDATKVWNRVYTYDTGDSWSETIATANATEVWSGTIGGSLLRIKDAHTGSPTILRTATDKFDNREDNGNGAFLPRVQEISAMHLLDANNGFFSHTGGVYDTIDSALQWRRMTPPSFGFEAMQIDYVQEDGKTSFRGFGVGMGGAIWVYKSGI